MHNQPLSLMDVGLAWGRVRHQRFLPKPNGFDTGAAYVRLVFGNGACAKSLGRWPAIDKSALVSVQAKHYGFEPPSAPHGRTLPQHASWMQRWASEHTGLQLDGEVHLHTFPKVLGFVFNPVSFWYFHTADAQCKAILCEVNNTFGERHFYLLQHADGGVVNKGKTVWTNKVFHVSPFFPVEGEYEFRFMDHGNRTLARINYWNNNTLQLTTSVSGDLQAATPALWIKTLGKFGWSSLQVVIKIHWQAVKLLLKGATFHKKPTPPQESLTQAKVQS